MRHHGTILLSTIALAGLGAACLAAPATASSAPPPTLTGAHEIAHFDESALQQPENIALEPDGAADVTFNRSREVARVGTDGSVTILATLPQSTAGNAIVSGIVRLDDGSLLVNYNAGTQSGIWRIPPGGGAPRQVAAVPGAGALNGLALDRNQGTVYATDSSLGVIWKVSPATGVVSVWAQGTELQPTSAQGKGANGIKVRDGAVWVSNTTLGTLLRIPIGAHGAAGPVTTVAQGVTGIDDFAFTGNGYVIAAQNAISQVSVVDPRDGAHQTVLTSANGLENPTSAAVRGTTVYVTSGAYFTHVDPNLLLAKLT